MTAPFVPIEMVRDRAAVTAFDHPLGGPVLRLAAAGGVAEIALQGAQLLSWQPKGHAPVIWLSPMERLAHPPSSPKPVRGGTPVCWPWFGPHPSDPDKPAHGFIRTRLWTVEATEGNGRAARVVLSTATTPADQALWPHSARVHLAITLGADLELALTTTNTGGSPFELTQALHTYFAIGDIGDVSVEGFDGQTYIDKVDNLVRKTQSGPIRFGSETDRVYDKDTDKARIVDPGLGRAIELTKSGSRSSVVWNPWDGKAARMGDMGPMGWRHMVCVETANAGDDVITLAPDAAHTMAVSYSVSQL